MSEAEEKPFLLHGNNLMKADEELSNTEYSIFYPTMNNPMIYDGGKLFPCDATQSRISAQATVAAVTNLLMEEPDIANVPTEDQKKKEKTAADGKDMTSADPSDSTNTMAPSDKKEAEKEAEENQTDEKEKQETSETSEKKEELEGSKEPEESKNSTEPGEPVELNVTEA